MCDIEFKNVSFSFGKRKILDDISFTIKQGDFVSIVGQNGSGKSVLVKHINGILIPTKGDVFVDGINTKDDSKIYDIRQKVGFMFQDPENQIIAGTVEEDVAFGPSNLGVERKIMRERVDETLKKLRMYEYRKFDVNKLSGGVKQKLVLAGTLVMNARCLVLDEPTSMLDPVNRKNIMDELIKLNKEENITLILLTHHMEEAKLANKFFLLESGKISQGDYKFIEEKFLKTSSINIDFNGEEKSKEESTIIECKNLSFKYEKNSEYIIKNLNCKIAERDVVEIIGSNGSGKSTFVHLLKGILEPSEGEIFLDGQKSSRRERNRKIGLVFQIPDYQLFEDDVLDEVAFGPKNMGLNKEEAKEKAIEALNIVGIDSKFFHYSPFELSGGMKKLVTIASILSMSPEILIFDEPTAYLDFMASKRLINLIMNLNMKQKKTIIIIHHTSDKNLISFNNRFLDLTLKFPVLN